MATYVDVLQRLLEVLQHVAPNDPIITLLYGTFQGKTSPEYNLTYFRRIPYAAPPIGPLRFRRPQPPLPVPQSELPYNTDQTFPGCAQAALADSSEDCLYLGLYSRPWRPIFNPTPLSSSPTPPRNLRPVLVIFYGGGFVEGNAAFTIPPPGIPLLYVSPDNDFVVVYPNYRLGAFGFLAGKEVKNAPDADMNVGFLDQEAALRWVQANIAVFGGDPEDVTIWGQSAGGGSVVAHVIGDGDIDGGGEVPRAGAEMPRPQNAELRSRQQVGADSRRPLFAKAILSSPFWPRTYHYASPEISAIYSDLVNLVGCNATTDTLTCLRNIPATDLATASQAVANTNHYGPSSFTWGPVLDDAFFRNSLNAATAPRNIKINARKVLSFYNTLEGDNFLPPNQLRPANFREQPGTNSAGGSMDGFICCSSKAFEKWLGYFLPNLINSDGDGRGEKLRKEVAKLYPARGEAEGAGWRDPFSRAGMVYRDLVLACPALWIAQAAAGMEGGSAWMGEYRISPATHAADLGFYSYPYLEKSFLEQPYYENIYHGYAGALASFVMTGDPNIRKLTPQKDVGMAPVGTGEQWVISEGGFKMQRADMLERRCRFWRENAELVPV
ncbi:alpha/beta-hydrolase [Aulographum hederae CBS 113979]|uniref:Carboxylic ester hydrolase n=1 Tax=Aulographum hederae CBS 113979 TaxID=1176131 RepID=A0A6G1H7V4_9PEZI|nr:alpha/beta-hydrolase [Aulographum hederae CBS 113979]